MISGTGEGLVFLLGLPRSGTTLLSSLLDDHPEIVCPPEPWIALALDSIGHVPVGHPADARVIGRATAEFLNSNDDLRTQAIRRFASSAYTTRLGDASILIDKTPRYWHILDQLESWFPDARYIHLRRNPFDIVASYLKTWSIDLADQLSTGVPSLHVLDLTLGLHQIEKFAEEHADRVCTVSYEDLVADTPGAMKELHGFLGVSSKSTKRSTKSETEDGFKLGDGVRRVTASTLGDKSILAHDHVHSDSVGSGLEALSDEQLRTVYDTIGRKQLVSMGYKSVADQLLKRGLKAPAAAKTNAIRQDAQQALAKRWERCRSWTDLDLELPPEVGSLVQSAQVQIQMALNERARAEGEYARVVGENEALSGEHAKLVQDRDALASEHDRLVHDRDALAEAHGKAVQEHDQLLGVHAALVNERDRIEAEQVLVVEQRDALSKQQAQSVEDHKALSTEHSQVVEDHEALSKNYARSIEELDALTKDYDKTVQERDAIHDERDHLTQELGTIADDLTRVTEERDEIESRAKRDFATAASQKRFLSREIERVTNAAESTRQRLTEASEIERAALQAELESVRENEQALDKEIHRVTDAYEHLAAKRRAWFFGPLGLFAVLGVRGKRLIEKCIARAGPRPDAGWPMITIVTPCFNAEGTIRETIESILGQNYPNLQYIIVDGGSTDATMDIVNQYKDRLALIISEPDDGMYDAVQKGFQYTTGEVMGYLNADDTFEPGGLWRVAKLFRDKPKMMVAYHEDTINTKGWRTPNAHQPKGVHFYDLLYGKHILFQDGVWWRHEAYKRVHGADSTFRYAGDYDLWLRMSMHFRFHRAPGHVSCFRKQAGQLSENMELYWEEVARSKKQLRDSIGWPQIIRRFPRWIRCKAAALFERRQRLFFPLNPGFGIPDAEVRPIDPQFPRCGLTGSPPDRLLFSTMDTRFGHTLLSRLWRCEDSDTVMMDPFLDQAELDHLYATYYSVWQTEPYPPAAGVESPYLGYRGPALLPRLAERFEIPAKVASRLNRRKLKHWIDVSMDELLWMLKGSADADDDSIRFLDIGCFNADLLDRLANHTKWTTCGSETNPEAVATARAKGHEIYEGTAEELWCKIPEDIQFDVIYLGQVIEHINDPYAFVRRIKTILKPGGTLIMTTPNLDSAQLDLYGPTWSHWHAPFHRVMFGRRGLKLIGERSGYKLIKMRSSSDPGWTLLSQKLNTYGIAGAVPHDYSFTPEEHHKACSLAAWSRLLWDWRNRGDYLLTAFRAE